MSAHLHLASTVEEATEQRPSRLVLADDHASVRRSLRLLLGGESDVAVIAEASDLSSAVRELRGSSPNVLLLDLHMRGAPGIETIRRLRAQAPETEIVVVTMEQSPVFAQQALEAGAMAYVLKDRADTELAEAVRSAARGLEYVSPQIAARLDALRRAVGGDGLTTRELEVLRLLALGHTSAEIANLRALITDLRPSLLDDIGLLPAIEALLDRRREEGLEIDAELALPEPSSDRRDLELETTIYRLVQEALTNVVKHAHAARAHVRVALVEAEIVVEVSDDGRGFDPDAATSGFGLAGMRERAFLAGGTLELSSSESGTLLRARLPASRRRLVADQSAS